MQEVQLKRTGLIICKETYEFRKFCRSCSRDDFFGREKLTVSFTVSSMFESEALASNEDSKDPSVPPARRPMQRSSPSVPESDLPSVLNLADEGFSLSSLISCFTFDLFPSDRILSDDPSSHSSPFRLLRALSESGTFLISSLASGNSSLILKLVDGSSHELVLALSSFLGDLFAGSDSFFFGTSLTSANVPSRWSKLTESGFLWKRTRSSSRVVAVDQSLSWRIRVTRGNRMLMPSAVCTPWFVNSAPVISHTGCFCLFPPSK